MRKITIIILVLILAFSAAACQEKEAAKEDGKITVAVSIVPEVAFVEAVAGDLVDVFAVIPKGNSPANYQPTTLEMQKLSDADIYFVMQVPTEEANILPKVSDFNKDIILINLRDAASEKYPLRHMEEHSHGEEAAQDETEEEYADVDPHIWLSPKRVIVMIETIAEELSKIDEANRETYRQNAADYIDKLNALDAEIKAAVDEMDNKSFMIYHGSYGYFADDYGLTMISLEADGKAATAAKMQQVIDEANEQEIKAIFYQDEFADTQARTIAEEIGGVVQRAAPLSDEYIESLKEFVAALTNSTGESK
ncbi:MAG: zinc ABC transporter substrate-binding protein [Eubacteriales bacterium]